MVCPVPWRVIRASAALRVVVGAMNGLAAPPVRKPLLWPEEGGRLAAAGLACIAEP